MSRIFTDIREHREGPDPVRVGAFSVPTHAPSRVPRDFDIDVTLLDVDIVVT
jgi:hypothetical protein